MDRFSKNPQTQIQRKCIQWEPRGSMRTKAKANNRLSHFCERA